MSFYSTHTIPEPIDADMYLGNILESTQVYVQYSYIAMLDDSHIPLNE